MGSKYWIKLYHEILHDPKMGMLDPQLWQRAIQAFLIAGEEDKEGRLPPLSKLAWMLRANSEQLETEMIELQRIGILSAVDGVWMVTNFTKRQEPMDKAEYMRRKRDQNKRGKYYDDDQPVTEPVTSGNTDTDTDTESDKNRIEDEDSPAKNFDDVQLWLEEIVKLPITPADIQPIQELTTAGITRGDIRGALQWRKDNSVKAARTVGQLKEGIITNRNKRIQDGSARKSGQPSAPRMTKRERSLAALEEARQKSKEREHGD